MVVEALEIYSLSKLEVYMALFLTLVTTMLYSRSLGLKY